jgi:hypothetical protein
MPYQPAFMQGPQPVLDSRTMPQQGPPIPAGVLGSPQQGPPMPMGQPQGSPFGGMPPGIAAGLGMGPPSPVRPAFDQWAQRMREMTPNPRGRGWQYALGSALLPALVGKLAGGSGREALLYGVGSAAYNFNNQLEDYREIERRISEAEAGLPQAQASYDLSMAQTGAAQAKTLRDLGLTGADPGGKAPFSGELQKGRNGNLWRFNTRNGQLEDTGVQFYETPTKPSMKAIETIDPVTGRPATVFVDANSSGGQTFVKPPSATEITQGDKAVDTLAKLDARQQSFNNQLSGITEIVTRASGDVGDVTSGALATLLQKTGMNVPYEDLKGDIETLQGNLAFLELNNMRQNSPTGGALGSITERELTLLASTVASLSQRQSPERLKSNLLKVQSHLNRIEALMAQDFENQRQQLAARAARAAPGVPAAPQAAPARPNPQPTPTGAPTWNVLPNQPPRKSANDYLNAVGQ